MEDKVEEVLWLCCIYLVG